MNRKVFALFGVVAVLLTAMAALTLSRVTPLGSGIGDLKCYDIKGEIDKCSVEDRSPLMVSNERTPHATRLDKITAAPTVSRN